MIFSENKKSMHDTPSTRQTPSTIINVEVSSITEGLYQIFFEEQIQGILYFYDITDFNFYDSKGIL
mgnify:CR=1 FL=1